jgi:signal transduction histidine kinase
MLGLVHLLFWLNNRQVTAYLLSALMGLSAAVSAMLELAMMTTQSLVTYSELLRWVNLAIFMILVPMVWFVYQYFHTGRRWLAITITVLWIIAIIINFLSPGNLTYHHLVELNREVLFWGEPFTLPVGVINPWKLLADIASLLILLYIVDATYKLWQQRGGEKTWIVGVAIVFFILAAGVHTPLVDARLVSTPYMISFSYLAIVFVLSYQVVMDAIRSAQYKLELQKARRRLDQHGQADLLGEYSVMLSHELNQPLTAILSNAQAAQRYLDSDSPELSEVKNILDDIVRDDQRASEIIKRIRVLLKNEEVKKERFDLNAAIREVIDMLSNEIKENDFHVTEHYASEILPVYTGRIEIQLVMLNLMSNALKVMKDSFNKKRRLSVRTSIVDHAAQVEIADTGPGISSERLDSLFERFVSDGSDGLGLGLSICRRIIEHLGGRIWAQNAETGGAVFTFTVPLENDGGNT